MRISDWSSDVCSSDRDEEPADRHAGRGRQIPRAQRARVDVGAMDPAKNDYGAGQPGEATADTERGFQRGDLRVPVDEGFVSEGHVRSHNAVIPASEKSSHRLTPQTPPLPRN